jgi:hypothetical protein
VPELPPTALPVPATPIGELRRWQLDIRCSRCRRHVVIRVEDLIQRHDRRTRIGGLVRRLRCDGLKGDGRCGGQPSRVVLAEVHVYGKSQRKVREVTVVGG